MPDPTNSTCICDTNYVYDGIAACFVNPDLVQPPDGGPGSPSPPGLLPPLPEPVAAYWPTVAARAPAIIVGGLFFPLGALTLVRSMLLVRPSLWCASADICLLYLFLCLVFLFVSVSVSVFLLLLSLSLSYTHTSLSLSLHLCDGMLKSRVSSTQGAHPSDMRPKWYQS